MSLSLSLSLSLSFYLSLSIFFGHVISSYHSEQMSQRSKVSRIAFRRCSQNVFVFVFVSVFVFVFVNEEDNGIGDVRYVKFLGILFSTTVSL